MNNIRRRSGRSRLVAALTTTVLAAVSLLVAYLGWAILLVSGCVCVREPCPCRDPGYDVLRHLSAILCFGTLVLPLVYWRNVGVLRSDEGTRRLRILLVGYLIPLSSATLTSTLMAID